MNQINKTVALILIILVSEGSVSKGQYTGTPFQILLTDSLLYPIDLNSAGEKLFPQGLVEDKAIIGLGESTHGTKEFNIYRAEFIKDQILNNNVRTIAVETDYSQSIILNDYLLSDLPNSEDSLLKKIYNSWLYGIYQTQEVFDLYSWIKDYNLKQERSRRISVVGMDMQYSATVSKRILTVFPALETIDGASFNNLVRLNQLYSTGEVVKLSEDDLTVYRQIPAKLDSSANLSLFSDTALLQQ